MGLVLTSEREKLSFLLAAVAHITILAGYVQWIKYDLRMDIA
jgi:hypothetical protein